MQNRPNCLLNSNIAKLVYSSIIDRKELIDENMSRSSQGQVVS